MAYADNIFTAIIDEQGDIYEASTGRKRQKVGVDGQREQDLLNQISEMQGVIENYHAKLVELGVITVPKSAEQIAREAAEQQTALMAQMMETMRTMQDEIRGLKANGNSRNCNEPSINPVQQNSASAGKTGKPSKGRDATGDKDDPGDTQ